MTVAISHNAINELERTITELENLTSKPGNLTRKEEQRHSFLLSKLSLLKQGISVAEIRHYEQDRLLGLAGLPHLPASGRAGRLPEEAEEAWRSFTTGGEIRSTYVPPDSEVRYAGQLAGQQSVTATLGAKGGFFVAPEMSNRLYQNLKKHDAIFDPEFCNLVETDTGAAMPFPIWSDVGNDAVQVGETTQSVEVTVAPISSVQLAAYAFRSQIVAVSIELLQDSNWPVAGVLEKIFAARLARGVGKAMILGSGVNQPNGLLNAAMSSGAAIVVASGSAANTGSGETGATSVGTQDLSRLYAAVNAAYRDPSCAFYMNDATLQYLTQLVDKFGHPIISFFHGPTDLDGPTPYLIGRRVAICRSMPTMAASANTVVFLNPNYFVQRRVPSSTYVRAFREAPGLVENGLVGFEMWSRFDSNLVSGDANFVPAAILQQHS